MRKVVAFEFVSLDGVAESPERFFTNWDDVVDAAGNDTIATQDTVVLGRRSYEEWSAYWPTSDIEPFASFINGVAKYIATSTPLIREWSNTSVIGEDLIGFVHELKHRPGQDIGLHASISVVRTLLSAGVVDELRLAIAPTVIGGGRRLLDGLEPITFDLIRAQGTPSGYLIADYRPTLGPA